ncbi:MAG: hypothetical protein Q9214_003856, partial [Letrouitia sp. 1 TL-2023]
FFGRSDVLREISGTFFSSSEVEDNLEDEGANEAKTFAICGPGGIGKTQIATEFAYSHKDQFDAIFWIFAATAIKVSEGFSKIAIELGLVDPDSVDSRDPVVTRDLVKGWLANPLKAGDLSDEEHSGRASWLLVFDNADDLTILEDVWPLDGPGCVLLTSRDPLAKQFNYLGMTGIDLKPFHAEEGELFLNRLTGKEGDSAAIVELLGGLPLAITQMAGVIIRRDLSFDEFVRTYNEEECRKEMFQLNLGHQNRRFGYEHTLASVWALDSLKRGRSLLEVLSFLDPDGIPEALLTTHPEIISLETFPKSLFSYHTARTELLQYSLISRIAETIQVHRLIQDVTRMKLDQPEMTAVFSAAVSLVTSVWPFEAFGWRHGVARWRECEKIFPQVLCLRQHHNRLNVHLSSFDADMLFAKLLTDAGWYSSESGNLADSLPLFIDAQSIVEQLRSSFSPPSLMDGGKMEQVDSLLAEIHHNIGCVSTEINDPKGALTHFEVFNNLMIQILNTESPGKDKRLAISWNELGNGYMLSEMWEKGLECFKTSISTMKRVNGFKYTDISFPIVNLGLAYWFTNQLEEASKTLLEGLRHREDTYGVDDKESFITGRFLYALGNVKTAQGRSQEGHSYHSRALSQYLSTIGKNHHRTGDAYMKMAEHYFSFEQYDEALLHLNQALRIFAPRAFLKPEKARALFKRSSVFKALGQPEKAVADRKESVELYYRVSSEIDGVSKRSDDLADVDFDRNIAFWSRSSQPLLQPEEYANAVSAHANSGNQASLYPGLNFANLASFLQQPFTHGTYTPRGVGTESTMDGFEFVQKYLFPSSTDGRMEAVRSPIEMKRAVAVPKPGEETHTILFLRGLPSPMSLSTIGAIYRIDPEFFQRHLDFRSTVGRIDYFPLPSLPSTSGKMIELTYISIGRRETPGKQHRPREMDLMRQASYKAMSRYVHDIDTQMATSDALGNSMVRSFDVLDDTHFAIEQRISIYMDQNGHNRTKITTAKPAEPSSPSAQSSALLASEYGKTLDKKLIATEQFYALHELFIFCAFSHSQYLNIIESKIDSETAFQASSDQIGDQSNILYRQRMLEAHANRLRTTIGVIRAFSGLSTPEQLERTTDTVPRRAAKSLLIDYQHLLSRTERLSTQCQAQTTLLMNRAMIAESTKAIQQAREVTKLTRLAFVFVPLSFTASVCGMNLEPFIRDGPSLWVWFALS